MRRGIAHRWGVVIDKLGLSIRLSAWCLAGAAERWWLPLCTLGATNMSGSAPIAVKYSNHRMVGVGVRAKRRVVDAAGLAVVGWWR